MPMHRVSCLQESKAASAVRIIPNAAVPVASRWRGLSRLVVETLDDSYRKSEPWNSKNW